MNDERNIQPQELPSPAHAHKDYSNPPCYQEGYSDFVPFPYIPLDPSMMQRINFNFIMNQMNIDYAYMKARAIHEGSLRAKQALDEYNDSRKQMTQTDKSDTSLEQIKNFDSKNHEETFTTNRSIVKVKKYGSVDWIFMIFDPNSNRHVPVDTKKLEAEYLAYLDEVCPEIFELQSAMLRRSFQRLCRHIPTLEQSGLTILEPTQLMFKNGFLELQTSRFYHLDTSKRKNYFTLFSFDVNLDCNENGFTAYPYAFDALLHASFDSDDIVQLAYEYIGAMLTPITTLKKVFAFQGKSQGGKTRLSNIITRLLPPEDTLILSNLSEISNDRLTSSPIRILYIQELGKNKLPAKQIAKLKAFADGSHLPGASSFKILLNTNYPIRTGDNNTLEPALANRLAILPFPKAMDNSDPIVAAFEDLHLEKEKSAIIVKALMDFRKVMLNNNQFSTACPINACVEEDDFQTSQYLSDTEREKFIAKATETPAPNNFKLKQLLDEMFLLTNSANPVMTPEHIMALINDTIPDALKDAASTGKILNRHFGDKLQPKRICGNTCYNLMYNPKTL